jgi:hypothetical protein
LQVLRFAKQRGRHTGTMQEKIKKVMHNTIVNPLPKKEVSIRVIITLDLMVCGASLVLDEKKEKRLNGKETCRRPHASPYDAGGVC